MNICVLSDQKQNLFCCYKIAKITNNIFSAKDPCQRFNLEINGEEQTVNFWTKYNGGQNNCYVLLLKELDSQIFANKMLDVIEKIKIVDPNYKCILLVNLFDSETKHHIDMKPKELMKNEMDKLTAKLIRKYEKKMLENPSDLLITRQTKIDSDLPDDEGEYIVQYSSYISMDEYINRKKLEFLDYEKNKFIEPYVFACCHNIHSIAVNLHNDNHVIRMIDLVYDMVYNRQNL
jgi:hypothetical protein